MGMQSKNVSHHSDVDKAMAGLFNSLLACYVAILVFSFPELGFA